MDRRILFATYALIGGGLCLIYSADHALGASNHFDNQLIMIAVGSVIMLGVGVIPGRYYHGYAYILYGASVFLLLLVPVFGVTAYGAKRWLMIAGIQIQPAEPAKLALIIVLARYLSMRVTAPDWKMVAIVAGIAMAPFVLVLTQPDMGTSTVFAVIAFVMLAWYGMPVTYFIFLLSPILALFAVIQPWVIVPILLIGFVYFVKSGGTWLVVTGLAIICAVAAFGAPIAWNSLAPYQQKRLTTFLDSSTDPLGAGYQIIQSQVAIGSGGFIGKGFLHGTQTQLRFLPEQHTDFIYAIGGEEFGLLGATTVLALFMFFAQRGYRLASENTSTFMSLVAAGATSLVMYHMIVNIGMAVGMLPVTGLPLPFVSYGRSFLVTCMCAVGVILSAGVYRKQL